MSDLSGQTLTPLIQLFFIYLMNTIQILEGSGFSLSLDYATFGSGKPKTLILSGIHGNERTGQLILTNLLRELPEFNGTLTVLPIANPLGFALNQRFEPMSGLDLNRQFNGKNDGRPAFLLTTAILELAKHYDYVIDLHSYTSAGLIQVGLNANDLSAKIAEQLSPDIVRIGHLSPELKINGTLSNAVRINGGTYVLIETPALERVTEDQIGRVVFGLKQHLLSASKYIHSNENILSTMPFVRIKLVKAKCGGVFERNPNLKLGDPVRVGDQLGLMTSLPDLKSVPVPSQYTGIICEMESTTQDAVVSGETLVGIGELLNENEKENILNQHPK